MATSTIDNRESKHPFDTNICNRLVKNTFLKLFTLSFLVVLLLKSNSAKGQEITFFEDDTTYNSKRVLLGSSILATGAVGSISTLSLIWYKDIPKSPFHFFDDRQEWLQMDKVGHTYTGWMLANTSSDVFHWSGIDKKKSILLGSLYSWTYLTTFEFLDGFAAEWGFSWWDIGANTLGTGIYAGQELLWEEQKFKLKFSAQLTDFAKYRPNVLGKTIPERILKDYNGQSYWISFSPSQFSEQIKIPKWICLSFGYNATGMIYGQESEPYIPIIQGQSIQFDRYRQYLFSLDVDFSEIPVQKPWLKRLFGVINKIKVPFPALVFSKNGVGFGIW